MIKLAIDMGTSTTKIYKIGNGVVLSEPTCVAINAETNEIKAIGSQAKKLVGKTAEYTNIVFPLFEGEIVNERMASAMLSYFLDKIQLNPMRLHTAEVLFTVPCGVTEKMKKKYYQVADRCGIDKISFVEIPYLAALGQDAPISDSNPAFILDIGGGMTNIAVLSLDGIIAGITLNLGGNNIDVHIIDYVSEKFNLKIGSLTSEKLKNTVGSLIEFDNQSTVVNGRDLATGRPRSVAISSSDLIETIKIYIDKILQYATMLLTKLPAEVSASICKNGVFLSGGICKLAGIQEYIEEKLQMETHLAQEPLLTVIAGGGKAIGNGTILKKIRQEY